MLSKEEIIRLKESFSIKFKPENVEYAGYSRFVVRECNKLNGNDPIIGQNNYRLFDDELNLIPLITNYNGIFSFTCGVAVVCIRENIQISAGRFTQDRKYGLIDLNGNELLPCIYNSISVKLDGHVELTKDGHKKATNVSNIIDGTFKWEKDV